MTESRRDTGSMERARERGSPRAVWRHRPDGAISLLQALQGDPKAPGMRRKRPTTASLGPPSPCTCLLRLMVQVSALAAPPLGSPRPPWCQTPRGSWSSSPAWRQGQCWGSPGEQQSLAALPAEMRAVRAGTAAAGPTATSQRLEQHLAPDGRSPALCAVSR